MASKSKPSRVRNILEPGTKVLNGRYEILKVIHSKGMSSVYLVTDSNLNKQWCLKEIRKSDAGKDNVEYEALLQEANIMKSLNHPSIPRITTIEEDGDSLFIVMDYVDGMSIKSWLSKKGKIDQDVVVEWMKQITKVMIYLHNRPNPIFYRDMKPDNVMIQNDGNIKVLDFGISLVIDHKGMVIEKALGTKGYAAPEQSKKGMVCDLRSDIYAMGKTMYYMLTGINPSQVPKEKLKPVREIDPGISRGLEIIVNKCTAENVEDRYQSCEEVLIELQDYRKYDGHRVEAIRKKILSVIMLYVTSLFLIGGSFIPLVMYRTQQTDYYEQRLMVAEQFGRASDYLEVLKVNAEKIEPYLGYVEVVKVDGVFDSDEEAELVKYLASNRKSLQRLNRYGELAFNIGKLYWFYYDGGNDEGSSVSVSWFKDAIQYGYDTDVANIYYQIGSFTRDIRKNVTEASDGGMYRQYWDNLLLAREVEHADTLIALQLHKTIADCISVYAFNLMQDGVTYEEVASEVGDLKSVVEGYSSALNSGSAKMEELFTSLRDVVGTLDERVSSVYKIGGGR